MNGEKIQPPEIYTFHNVMFWEPESKKLLRLKQPGQTEAGTLLKKAKSFLEFNCVERITENLFRIKPIPKYNKTTYQVTWPELSCNCRGFANNKFCSHCLAVRQYVFMRENVKI